jgi:hypothetical protein
MTTKNNLEIESTTFKGSPVLTIWELNDQGERKSEYPLISFGKKKAQAIAQFSEEIDEFATSEKK